ncbi:MAG: DUF262 domain-containing protein [Paludibacteraceae bacterium]|nr:DUF262 domain-containing protein [Paludibacteraceae bacterium]
MNIVKDAEVLNVENLFKDKYIIPLYQRNFAWREEQISRLLQDIYESMCSGDEHFYLGSLIVLQRSNGEMEVIDGQQRLTMLSILSGILNMGMGLSLRYDSRPEVEEFFRLLHSGVMPKNRKETSISHFFEAIDLALSTQLDVEKSEPITLKAESVKIMMADYIKHHVCVVREIMPSDTDVAAYFEIMNNRGEQLQEHEIIKGLLLGKLHEDGHDSYSQICSKIWDSCSQMGIRIQKSFAPTTGKILFGEDYSIIGLDGKSNDINFGIHNIPVLNQLKVQSEDVKTLTLEEIVEHYINTDDSAEVKNNSSDYSTEESIIDFPNFLMHIFRLYYNPSYRNSFQKREDAKDIPLSEKYLLRVYNTIKYEIKPLDFFLRLLYCRVIFDKYVVKSNVTDDDEKREWVLLKPYIYEDTKRNTRTLRFKPTFDDQQNAVIHSLSCLQVSFRAKPYKNFLQTILSWFVLEDVAYVENTYLKRLHRLMLDEFNRTSTCYIGLTEYDEKRQGTSVNHYLFNFTDYLYWWIKYNNKPLYCGISDSYLTNIVQKELELISKNEFRFLNRNSIEHHYPQKRRDELDSEGVNDFDLNCLGNLILISKSVNSRLSDKNPLDKAALYSDKTDLPPTRQIIYSITRNEGWGKQQILTHFKCVEFILAHREQILLS